ncbi:MAG: YcxB family protein [Clostridiales bacterium]|nr:YcxB family protein [Clostridiales bacterium]
MELSYKNSELDFFKYYKKYLSEQTAIKIYRRIKSLIMIPIGMVLAISIYFMRLPLIKIHEQVEPEDIIYIILPILFGVLWYISYTIIHHLSIKENLSSILKNISYDYNEEINIKFNEDGIIAKRESSSFTIKWNGVKEFYEDKELLYIILVDRNAIIIPKDVFNEENTKEDLIKLIKENI